MKREDNQRWIKFACLLIIFSGIIISLISLLYNRSLWLDEAMLSLNIINKSYIELLSPLEMGQVAPIGFLYIQKFATSIFGNYDWVLRVVPFLAFIFSIPSLFFVTKKLFNSTQLALLTSAFFSINVTLIWYAVEAKQYSVDVLVAILIVLCALNFNSKDNNKSLFLYGLIGVVSVWFSNISIIMLFTVGLYSLFLSIGKEKKKKYLVFIPLFSWVISFLIYYICFIYNHPHTDHMVNYWKDNFLPQNIFSAEFYSFLSVKIRILFQDILSFSQFWIFPLFFSIVAIKILLKKKKSKYLYLPIFPLLLHLILSSFQLYPFHKRLILYLTPFITILFTFGFVSTYKYLTKKVGRVPKLILFIPILFLIKPLAKELPFEKEEIKKSLKYIDEHISSNEPIYVYYASKAAFIFYVNRYHNITVANPVFFGESYRKDWDTYSGEIQEITQSEIWLIFSHAHKKWHPVVESEENYIIKSLKSEGFIILDVATYKNSACYKIRRSN